ncbi:GMC oxidoreductase [Kitasatospora sp. NPDC058046]|uniref:GMC oxidoreductase n=1 Tax=Kitasatospora sp. NPDC058046 TaxID=3346312 RepID=UPI0036D76850
MSSRCEPDVVVVGAGLTGCVLASQLLDREPSLRVLVLESGPWAAPDHGQTAGHGHEFHNRLYREHFTRRTGIAPSGIIEAVGGGSLAWTAVSPRPRPSELAGWPSAVRSAALSPTMLARAERLMGVTGAHSRGPLVDPVADALRIARAAGRLPFTDPSTPPGPDDCATPIATAAEGHAFSPVPLLSTALTRHASGPDPRLDLRTECRLTGLGLTGSRVRTLRTTHGEIPLGAGTAVVLATNTVEATRQVLLALPNHPLAGRNLIGHLQSTLIMRVPAPSPRPAFEWGTLLLPGHGADRHLQVQVRLAHGPIPGDRAAVLRRRVPGLSGPGLFAGADERHLAVHLTAVGEIGPARDDEAQRITLSRSVRDTNGTPVAEVSTRPDLMDDPMWEAMDDALETVAAVLARPGTGYGGTPGQTGWDTAMPARAGWSHGGRRWEGCVHSAGTLWMSDSAESGVTDPSGRVHGVDNLYVTGLALFPSAGSHNGGLTAVALALALADRLTGRAAHPYADHPEGGIT